MKCVLCALLAACSSVETHVATSPTHFMWAEPGGKASYPLVFAFDGGPVVQTLGRLGYGVVVMEPSSPDEALRVLEAARNTMIRWDGQLVILGVSQGARAATALAEVRPAQGAALLMSPYDATPLYFRRFDSLNELLPWLCRTAFARGCPRRPPSEPYKAEDTPTPDQDVQLRAK